MKMKNFKQYDTRWAKLGYPKAPHYIKDCGCGEVSIANCIVESSKYANETPKTIQPYCKQYAAPNGDGTYYSGIPAMMKHYGMTEVKEHQTMKPLWEELEKGHRVAVYLMGTRAGGSKGVHWTSCGHFVCSTDYKKKDGKHYVYVKDSNSDSSLRNGWITYEENMKGDVVKVWSGKLPRSAMDKACSWAKKIADNGDYKYKKYTNDVKTHQCPICHDLKGKYKGWNCIGFAFACWHHGGKIPCKCSCDAMNNAAWETIRLKPSKDGTKIVQNRLGIDDVKVIRRKGGKTIPMSKLKKGDIIAYFNGTTYAHTALYLGNGKISDCTSGRNPQIKYGTKSYTTMKIKAAIRYTGK